MTIDNTDGNSLPHNSDSRADIDLALATAATDVTDIERRLAALMPPFEPDCHGERMFELGYRAGLRTAASTVTASSMSELIRVRQSARRWRTASVSTAVAATLLVALVAFRPWSGETSSPADHTVANRPTATPPSTESVTPGDSPDSSPNATRASRERSPSDVSPRPMPNGSQIPTDALVATAPTATIPVETPDGFGLWGSSWGLGTWFGLTGQTRGDEDYAALRHQKDLLAVNRPLIWPTWDFSSAGRPDEQAADRTRLNGPFSVTEVWTVGGTAGWNQRDGRPAVDWSRL